MTLKTVLIVEDDKTLREALVGSLSLAGITCYEAEHGKEALECIKSKIPSLVITDINMDVMGGFELMREMHKQDINTPIIMMTAYADVNQAVIAMREGAIDYLQKPFSNQDLLEKIENIMPVKLMDGPVVEDRKSLALLRVAEKVAKSDATVLICGESGTGKEVLSRYIHDHSLRADKPFVAINCAAIPENMLEATLFGYEKGAFTGAYKATAGKFELANSGTLLLDEISEMSLPLQAKLLRVLQEREVERIGSHKVIPLDVRILATTNRDMKEEIKAQRFREDLYYRINVFPLQWQPLRQRPDDILPLVEMMFGKHLGDQQPLPLLSTEAREKLLRYTWPGNIRELDNVVQRALILRQGDTIQAEHIQVDIDISKRADQHEELIIQGLKEALSRQEIADQLGISTRTLRYKMAKMREAGVEIPNSSGAETI